MVHELVYRRNGPPSLQFSNVGAAAAATVFMPYLISPAAASPLGSGGDSQADGALQVRANNQYSLDVQIWVPIIVIALIILSSVATYAYRRAKAARSTNNRPATATTNPATRELTAEQLAGTINNGAQAQANANAGATRTRRARRPRRTPSQVSTRSLPVYAKEPGEQEVVIARGTEDMEDVGMPTATVMSSVYEDGEDSLHSRNQSQASQYPPLPTTPNDTPLLHQEDDDHDDRDHAYAPRREHHSNRQSTQSYDTSNISEETSSLMRTESHPAPEDPRGPTPAYFEAVESPFSDNQDSRTLMQNMDTPSTPTSPTTPETTVAGDTPSQRRRSGFRNLIGSIPNRLSMHSRGPSSLSGASNSQSHGRETSQSRPSHRPSQPSNTSSFINLSPFRSRSRQQSVSNMQNLTSPSLISLASISSPLTHTATRTEFAYPKAGPTPEQLKLISSRESFGRFGVPYGPDAVAFAASQERVDHSVPPPDFETAAASPNMSSSPLASPGLNGTASPTPGQSRLRSSTIVDDEDVQEALDRPGISHSDLMDAHALAASSAVVDTPETPAAAPSSVAVGDVPQSQLVATPVDGVLGASLGRSVEPAPEPVEVGEVTKPDTTPASNVTDKDPAFVPLPLSPPASPEAVPVTLPAHKSEAHFDSDVNGGFSDDTEDEKEVEDSEDEKDTSKRDTIMVTPKRHSWDNEDENIVSKRDTVMMPKYTLPPLSIPSPIGDEEPASTRPKPQASAHLPPQPTQPKSSAAVPPSAFRSPSSFSLTRRSESRASSVRSYATAAESAYHTDYSSDDDNYVSGRETPGNMYESAYDDEDDEDPETPTTPKIQSAGLPSHDHGYRQEQAPGHVPEASDATVRAAQRT